MLEITEIVVTPIKEPAQAFPILGFARIVLNGVFVVSSIKIIDGKAGRFIAWPRERVIRDGREREYNIAHPISQEVERRFSARILEVFKEVTDG